MRKFTTISNKLTCIAACLTLSSAFCAAQDLPVLRVTFPASELVYEEYTQGEMRLEDTDGSVVELPARFKTRGATARAYTMKPAFNMKLRELDGTEIDSTLLGLRKASSFILDAMAIDRICMRNRVCFDIWNDFSKLPYETEFDSRNGTVGKFVEVYMNDQYKGIYCLTDRVNRKLLDLKKPQVEDDGVTIRGVLYKHGTTDIEDQNTPGFYNDTTICVAQWHDAWELTEPEDYPCKAAWQPLLDYYDNNVSYNYITEHFYEENIADYVLFIMAMSIEDNWGNKNKYFSIRNIQETGKKGRIVITPWDLDTSLGGAWNGNYYDGNYSEWEISSMLSSALPPFSTCLARQEFNKTLRDKWIEARKSVFSVDAVKQRLYEYRDLFINSGAWKRQTDYWDKRSDKPCYVADLAKEIDLIVGWYEERFHKLDTYFDVKDDESGVSDIRRDDKRTTKEYSVQGTRIGKTSLGGKQIHVSDGKKWIAR